MSQSKASSFLNLAFPAIMIGLACIGLLTYTDYGDTFDNYFDMMYGQYMLHFLKTGERLFEVEQKLQLSKYYGPVGDTLAALFIEPFQPVSYARAVELRHLFNFFFSLAGFAAAYHFVASAVSKRVGVFVLLLLVLSPRLYGHSFNNSKDPIFAAFFMLSLWGVFFYLQKKNYKRLVLSAFVIGICMDQRVGAIFVLPPFFLAATYDDWRAGLFKVGGLSAAALTLAKRYAVFIAVFAITVYLFFPFLWPDPIGRMAEVFKLMSAFPDVKFTFFRGENVSTAALPRSYAPVLLHITMPVVTVALVYAGLVFGALRLIGRGGTLSEGEAKLLIIAISAVAFPLGVVLVKNTPLYDGIRHLLFLFYPLTILAAFGMERALYSLRDVRPRAAAAVAFVAYYFFIAYSMVSLHPYQALYFNELAGGLKGADGRYETDYWGSSYKEGIEWLNANTTGEVRVETGTHFTMSHYFRPGITVDDNNPDFYLSIIRYNEHEKVGSAPIHVVRAGGVALLYIKPVSEAALKKLKPGGDVQSGG